MTAGAVTVATGEDRLSRLGGLARPMPRARRRARRRRREPGGAAADRRVLQGRAVLRRRVGRRRRRCGARRRRRGADVRLHRRGSGSGCSSGRAARRRGAPIPRAARRAGRACWRAVALVLGGLVVGPFADLAADAAAASPHGAPGRARAGLPPGRARREHHGAGRVGDRRRCCSSPAAWRPVVRRGRRAPATASAPRGSTGRRCTRSTGCRTACTTGRCATCAPASRPCSCRPACWSPRASRHPDGRRLHVGEVRPERLADRRAARARGRCGVWCGTRARAVCARAGALRARVRAGGGVRAASARRTWRWSRCSSRRC